MRPASAAGPARGRWWPRAARGLLLALLALAGLGCGPRGATLELPEQSAAPPRRLRPFASGERLVYRARVAGVDAAHATLSVGDEIDEAGRPTLPLRVTVEGYSWLTRFYPLKIKLISRVDPATLAPQRMEREGSNGSLPRSLSLDFDPGGRVKVRIQIQGEKEKRYLRRTDPAAFDTVSGLYDIRAWLMSGEQERTMHVFDGGFTRAVHLQRGPVEEVWSPAGWFRARRFDVEARRVAVKGDRRKLPAQKEPERFSAWVTDDERLVPVRLLGQTPVGPAEVLLEGFAQGPERLQPLRPADSPAEGAAAGAGGLTWNR